MFRFIRHKIESLIDYGRAFREAVRERRNRRREVKQLDEDGRLRRDLAIRAGFQDTGILMDDGDARPDGYERLADDDSQMGFSGRPQSKFFALNSGIADWQMKLGQCSS